MSLIIGIDGCKSGWFAVWQNQDEVIETAIFQSMNNLKDFFIKSNQLIIGIDIPVVLSEVMPREADQFNWAPDCPFGSEFEGTRLSRKTGSPPSRGSILVRPVPSYSPMCV